MYCRAAQTLELRAPAAGFIVTCVFAMLRIYDAWASSMAFKYARRAAKSVSGIGVATCLIPSALPL